MCKLFIVPLCCLECKDEIVYGQPSPLGQTWTGRALFYVNWVQLNPVTSLNELIQLGCFPSWPTRSEKKNVHTHWPFLLHNFYMSPCFWGDHIQSWKLFIPGVMNDWMPGAMVPLVQSSKLCHTPCVNWKITCESSLELVFITCGIIWCSQIWPDSLLWPQTLCHAGCYHSWAGGPKLAQVR